MLAHQAAAVVGHENVLAMGNCCYAAVCSAAQGASAPRREERGRGISWQPPAYSLLEVVVAVAMMMMIHFTDISFLLLYMNTHSALIFPQCFETVGLVTTGL